MRDAQPTGSGNGLQVSVSRDAIRDAPGAQDGGDLSAAEERQLYEHYEQTYPDEKTADETRPADETKTADKSDRESRRPGLLRRLLGRDHR